jgi:hypothetical protein
VSKIGHNKDEERSFCCFIPINTDCEGIYSNKAMCQKIDILLVKNKIGKPKLLRAGSR